MLCFLNLTQTRNSQIKYLKYKVMSSLLIILNFEPVFNKQEKLCYKQLIKLLLRNFFCLKHDCIFFSL